MSALAAAFRVRVRTVPIRLTLCPDGTDRTRDQTYRNALGALPVSFLTARLKVERELKPTS